MIVKFENIDSIYRQIAQSACGGCACSVFILVANEVDAMASARILTQVLRSDNITYKIRPVAKFSHVTQSVKECIAMEIKSVIMINCGAIYNIPKYFDLEQGGDMRCYILDNHRPIHLANIYSRTNVIVLDGGSVDDLAELIPSDGSDLESVGDSTSEENDSDSVDEFNDEEDDDDEERDLDENEPDDAKSIEKVDEENGDAEFGDDEIDREEEEEEESDVDDNNSVQEENNNSTAPVEDDVSNPEEEVNDEEDTSSVVDSTVDDLDNPDLNSENINPNIVRVKTSNKPKLKPLLTKTKVDKSKIALEISNTLTDQDEQQQEEEDIENEEEEDVVVVGGRRKISEAVQQHRKRRRKLRSYYDIGHYYTIPTAVQLINLIKLLNKPCSYDVIWMAVLGLTEQYQRYHISEELYHIICDSIKAELPVDGPKRWKVGEGVEEVYVPGSEAGQVFDGLEFRFFMYRHWTLFESMLHSEYTAVKMEVWRGMQGENKLQELFSKLALPLKEVKQSYKFMDPEIRGHFRKNITGEEAQNCNLKNPTAVYKSFYRCNSFKNPVAAADVVYAATALLERGLDSLSEQDDESGNSNNRDVNNDNSSSSNDVTTERRRSGQALWLKSFNESYDSLSCNNAHSEELLKKGVDHAITLQKAMMVEAASLLDSGKSMSSSSSSRITRLKAFRYAYIHLTGRQSGGSSSTSNVSNGIVATTPMSVVEGPFTRPQHLTRLANFVMHLQISNGMWTGKNAQPLVLISEKRNTYLIVGVVPPEGAYKGRNGEKDKTPITTNFRQLFSMAAEEINARYRNDSFDSNAIEIDRDDVASFVENLMVLINSK